MTQETFTAEKETIVAPITAPGVGAVTIVRMSGEGVRGTLRELCPKAEEVIGKPRTLVYASINDQLTNENEETILDNGLIVFFPAPNSFTGEDVVEFHLHGGAFISERLLENVLSCGGRLAEPGEFSRRAYLNGRLDLCQAEAIADLVTAETESQARVAREQFAGRLSGAVAQLGEPLRDLLAEIEAYIDFPEEDIEPENVHGWQRRIHAVQEELERYLETFATGRLYREGARVSIAGLPNAGKSSLLNQLVGEDRVIVTPVPGTTRDHIEERVSLGGVYVHFSDTAGISDYTTMDHSPDEVEKFGVARSWKQVELADLVLYVIDGTLDITEQEKLLSRVQSSARALLGVINKLDLLNSDQKAALRQLECRFPAGIVYLSALTGQGIAELKDVLRQTLVADAPSAQTRVLITNRRHFEALKLAAQSLAQTVQGMETNAPPELISVDLRAALGELNDIVGVTHSEDILDRIFSKFCIGK